MADQHENFLFVHNFEFQTIVNTPSIVLYKSGDEGQATYEGDLSDEEQIKEFILYESVPLVMEFN